MGLPLLEESSLLGGTWPLTEPLPGHSPGSPSALLPLVATRRSLWAEARGLVSGLICGRGRRGRRSGAWDGETLIKVAHLSQHLPWAVMSS